VQGTWEENIVPERRDEEEILNVMQDSDLDALFRGLKFKGEKLGAVNLGMLLHSCVSRIFFRILL